MRTTDIFVTNRNDFTHEDSFDGVGYVFPPNERVAVPVDAAVHMFGFNQPDKSEVLTRLGWAWHYESKARNFVEDPEGVRKLARFVFTRAVMVEETVGEADTIKVPPPAKRGIDFLQTDAPLV